MDSQSMMIVLVVLVVALVIAVAWLVYKQMQTRKLTERFGPEYKRALREHGDRSKAESELMARAERVEHLNITPLSPADAAHFGHSWEQVQAGFVDDPKGAIARADKLVREVMLKRGYPMGDFERRAADISVDHASVVDHYRAAQDIANRDARGQATTEDLRKAVVHYRALFNDLLEVRNPEPAKHAASTNRIQRA